MTSEVRLKFTKNNTARRGRIRYRRGRRLRAPYVSRRRIRRNPRLAFGTLPTRSDWRFAKRYSVPLWKAYHAFKQFVF